MQPSSTAPATSASRQSDPHLIEPADALVAVARAAICGSDLWPYRTMEHSDTGRRMGHEFIGVVEAGRRPFDADRIVVAVPTQKNLLGVHRAHARGVFRLPQKNGLGLASRKATIAPRGERIL